MNSAVEPIFNEKVAESEICGSMNSALCILKAEMAYKKKRKKKKRKTLKTQNA